MKIVMSIKEWEVLMKYINKNNLKIVKAFEIGKTDENILGVNYLAYLSNNMMYGYSLKESTDKFYNVNEISEDKVSFDINAEDLIEFL